MGFNSGFTVLQTTSTGGSVDLTATTTDIIPTSAGTQDLGSTTLQWDDLFLESIVLVSTSSTPNLETTGGILWVSSSGFGGDELYFSGSEFGKVELTNRGGIGGTDTSVYFAEDYYDLTVTEAATSYVSASFNSGSLAHLQASGSFDLKFVDIPTTGKAKSMTMYVSQSSTTPGVITWDPAVIWPGGTAPTLTNASGSIDAFTFFTSGSARVVGFTSGQNLS